jgi:chemotaxis protein MotA
MTLEGILSIQAGDNPRVVSDKLLSFIPPAERVTEEDAADAGVPGVGAPAEAELAVA